MKQMIKILILTLALGTFAGPTWASEGAKPSADPGSALDSWDDDVWADWSNSTTTKGGAPQTDDREAPGAKDDLGLADGIKPTDKDNGFGEGSDRIRFRLVRDGSGEGPKGMRKYRPAYGKRSL